MKTQKEFEDDLYKKDFERKRKKWIVWIGILPSLIFGLIFVLAQIRNDAQCRVIVLFVAIISIFASGMMIAYYDFLFPCGLEKKKGKLQRKIKKLQGQLENKMSRLGPLADPYYKDHADKRQTIKEKFQKKIWKLEFRLKMLGGEVK